MVWLVFIGSLQVFFKKNRSKEPLVRIKSDFQRWNPIACQFPRGTPGEHGVFAPRARRRRKPENPVVKRRASPKFIGNKTLYQARVGEIQVKWCVVLLERYSGIVTVPGPGPGDTVLTNLVSVTLPLSKV